MSRIIAIIKLKVQCHDGSIYENATLAIEDNRRIYLTADGAELEDVECIKEGVAVLPPMALAAVLSRCKECEQ